MMADSKTRSQTTTKRWLFAALAAMVSTAILMDIVYAVYIRGKLQVATDASATAGARGLLVSEDQVVEYAMQNARTFQAEASPVSLARKDVELGFWDASSRRFAASTHGRNAVRVTARGGAESLLLGRLFGITAYDVEVSTVAIARPRDIVFVVDLSGAMNDDVAGQPSSQTIENLYDDLRWNMAAARTAMIDAARFALAWGNPQSSDAQSDDARPGESVRHAAIRWIIDHQIAIAMPDARPTADSSLNYEYWADYLRFLTTDCDSPQSSRPIGYRTYLQFMLAQGRDLKPDNSQYTPLSLHSPDCATHEEVIGNQRFTFPPRCQPMHAVRRGLIAAVQQIKRANSPAASGAANIKDRVAVVTFDRLIGGGVRIAAPLTDDYDAVMAACSRLQAVGDLGNSSAVEAGLAQAAELLKSTSHRGSGRSDSEKMIVFISGSTPDLFVSTADDLRRRMLRMPALPYYPEEDHWLNAPLLLAAEMRADSEGPSLHGVGVGPAADVEFLRRLSRAASQSAEQIEPAIAAGEKHLVEVLERIFSSAQATIVQ